MNKIIFLICIYLSINTQFQKLKKNLANLKELRINHSKLIKKMWQKKKK